MASYHKAIRLLLQPRLYEPEINKRYLDICAEACRGVLETYKSLLYKMPLVFTSVSLQTVFLAGLTLIYCMWHDASSPNGFRSFSALSDCSIVLYVMSEKWPAGKRYRDLFESVKKSVLDAISAQKHVSRTVVTSMKENTEESLRNFQVETSSMQGHRIRDDLEQMISDMTGGAAGFWDEADVMEMDGGTDFSAQLGMGGGSLGGLSAGGVDWEASDSNNIWFETEYVAQEYGSLGSEK